MAVSAEQSNACVLVTTGGDCITAVLGGDGAEPVYLHSVYVWGWFVDCFAAMMSG
jgi:hypothetical protein